MTTLIVLDSAPFQTNNLRDGLDVVLTLAAFDLQPSVLLRGQGVNMLTLPESTSSLFRNPKKVLGALPMYDVEHIFVDKNALKTYSISPDLLAQLPIRVTTLGDEAIGDLFHQYQKVVVF